MLPSTLKQTSIDSLPNTRPKTRSLLQKLGIQSYWDLLNHIPSRYEDYSSIVPIAQCKEGFVVTVHGIIADFKQSFARRGITIQRMIISDGDSDAEVTWFNQRYLATVMKPSQRISLAAKVKETGPRVSLVPQSYEVLKTPDQPTVHTGRITAVYPETKGLTSRTIREKLFFLLNTLKEQRINPVDWEWFPEELVKQYAFIDILSAYHEIHFPHSVESANAARARLAMDELFPVQLSAALTKQYWLNKESSRPWSLDGENRTKIETFIKQFPFVLTNAQQRCTEEIIRDLQDTKPMNRFLQGDVGSGKTAVAAVALYAAYLNGYQALVMAPTEVLARQHYKTLTGLFQGTSVTIGLQTGSEKITSNEQTHVDSYDIVVGTHALLSANVSFEKIGLVVIDEQHKFGVKQRASLKSKSANAHLLTLTATPIPRTVALTLYGELDMSIIDEMPEGRFPIKTYVVPQKKRSNAYDWIRQQIAEHETQVYIICPLIEESASETMQSVRAATDEAAFLQNTLFPDHSVGLLHGRLKPDEKHRVMQEFQDKKHHILVSTSVVEVGIDVPNASIIIIEGAERYGLAQLHQLRGRVGRGSHQSYCYLFTSREKDEKSARLKYFSAHTDGMKLAEYDLKHRGPGQIYGTQQHGKMNLKVASLTDYALITKTQAMVNSFLSLYSLDEHPEIRENVERYQSTQIARD